MLRCDVFEGWERGVRDLLIIDVVGNLDHGGNGHRTDLCKSPSTFRVCHASKTPGGAAMRQ